MSLAILRASRPLEFIFISNHKNEVAAEQMSQSRIGTMRYVLFCFALTFLLNSLDELRLSDAPLLSLQMEEMLRVGKG